MINVRAEIAAAMRRVFANIERRARLALGEKPQTVSRSVGQRYGRRGKFTKSQENEKC